MAWDTANGRLDFASLQARLTAGRRIGTVAARRPAQLVCFDLLAYDSDDLRPRPLRERRRRLADLLLGQAPPIVLCQHTDDRDLAAEWLATLTAGGLEGILWTWFCADRLTDANQSRAPCSCDSHGTGYVN